MNDSHYWIDADDLALLTDLYELTMMQAYFASAMHAKATFSLYFRKLPDNRNFMLACGQQHAARLLAGLRFSTGALDQLATVGLFRDDFLRWLADFRFSGDIVAMPEATPVFAYEPLLEVTAPIAEAQLLETLLMNLTHLETVLASKAVRMVLAARGRPVIDFGMRRMHGLDAAMRGVRAYKAAGIAGTSNVLAGLHYDLPVRGTMAHSFVQACENQIDAFKLYADLYPGTTLLVDTYDTLEAVDSVIKAKRERGDAFNVGAIRLDSGDLAALARQARARLDRAGLRDIRIVASGGLDENKIDNLVRSRAPIDAFGVGTALGTSADAPNLDLAYKLTTYDGGPMLKTSPGKPIYPGPKQVWRHRDEAGALLYDEVTLRDETRRAEPLLESVVGGGRVVLSEVSNAAGEVDRLPPALRNIAPADPPYEIRISDAAQRLRDRALADLRQP